MFNISVDFHLLIKYYFTRISISYADEEINKTLDTLETNEPDNHKVYTNSHFVFNLWGFPVITYHGYESKKPISKQYESPLESQP